MPTAAPSLTPTRSRKYPVFSFHRPLVARPIGRRPASIPKQGSSMWVLPLPIASSILPDTDPHPEGYGAAEKNAGSLGNDTPRH